MTAPNPNPPAIPVAANSATTRSTPTTNLPMRPRRNINLLIATLLFVTSSIVTIGCTKKEENNSLQNAANEMGKGVSNAISDAQKSLAEKFKTQQSELSKQLAELKVKAEKAPADVKAAITAAMPEMEKSLDTASKRVSRLATDTSGDWKTMGDGVKATLDDLQKKLADAAAKLK